jgi:DNA-binding transcriptional ArsR family regulator
VSTNGHPLDALGDPTRRQVFELLRSGPRSVGDLAAKLPVSRPAVSQHLRVLESAGLVSHRKQGTRHLYELERSGVAELRSWVDGFWDEALARFKEAAAAEGGTQ